MNLTQTLVMHVGYDAQVSSRQNAHGLVGGFQINW
jgi:hypothetical protein